MMPTNIKIGTKLLLIRDNTLFRVTSINAASGRVGLEVLNDPQRFHTNDNPYDYTYSVGPHFRVIDVDYNKIWSNVLNENI